MAPGALIAAIRDADDGSGLVAALPVAGRALIERQARLAVAAGVERIVILVERLPGALTLAIDRLRRDGISVDVARSAGDAADRFHPDERVLVMADGALAPAAMLSRLTGMPAPALLTLGESGPVGGFERIDAATRWAGVALVSGEMLRKTVAMLGDWDLHSTLLRRAVGASARRIDIADGADLGDPAAPQLVRSRGGAQAATQAGLAAAAEARGWPARFLYAPAARLVAGALIDRMVAARWLRWVAIGVTAAGAGCFARGWIMAALLLFVLGASVDAVGRLLAALRLTATAARERLSWIRGGVAGLGLIGFGWHRLPAGWGPIVLTLAIGAVMAALAREEALVRGTGGEPPRWAADADALVLLFAPFAALHATSGGLGALAAYAALSFVAVQHRLAQGLARR